MDKPKCSECCFHKVLRLRPDEIARNVGPLECRKPGWEGYTSDEHSACDGAFFISRNRPEDNKT